MKLDLFEAILNLLMSLPCFLLMHHFIQYTVPCPYTFDTQEVVVLFM